jgi:hypothetical protein
MNIEDKDVEKFESIAKYLVKIVLNDPDQDQTKPMKGIAELLSLIEEDCNNILADEGYNQL